MPFNWTEFTASATRTVAFWWKFDSLTQTAVLSSRHTVQSVETVLQCSGEISSTFAEPRHICNTSWDLQRLSFAAIIGFLAFDLLSAFRFLNNLFCDVLTSSSCF
jgi:hypothetical protein